MVTIRLTNSMTHRKEEFVPFDAENVRMYVCGPTVYDRAHLGNARPVVVFDVLYRLLRQVYGAEHVTYVRNFTDVDDKINAKAAETGRDIRAITDETIGWYHADMDALGALRPDHEPRATEYIGAMIAMIDGLIAKGHAYAANGHVLFRVRSYAGYGALSGRSVDDMIAGARVEVAPFKEDPMDFVLWKPSEPGVPGWESPWGFGRPGWHIECSAMSRELLGETFDIHGGGLDLQFPHHENEIAQSCCAHGCEADAAGKPQGFARTWLHNEMLLVEGKKMSKSLGNFFTVRDLLDDDTSGAEIRYVFMMTHYRSPMDWTSEKAVTAGSKLRDYLMIGSRFADLEVARKTRVATQVIDALSDDLNTHLALVEVDRLLGKAEWNEFVSTLDFLGLIPFERFEAMQSVLKAADAKIYDWTQRLISLRAEAKTTKDFSAVDLLKSQLADAGVKVQMSQTEIELIPGPNFDPAKLEALK
ncbi:cysteine--tRNA ligase [Pseudotabrizicola formosa]|uniref:cysteine--tRNA ligase n=1 Tax=Pseudotabrizicola formosa TaxID=2030009 RepID=UPI000CD09068|nr:cysteine--tRNA ligase [Pseudotabrizicola formosa]